MIMEMVGIKVKELIIRKVIPQVVTKSKMMVKRTRSGMRMKDWVLMRNLAVAMKKSTQMNIEIENERKIEFIETRWL